MNIYTEKGVKIVYLGTGGYDSDKEHANKYLKVGEIYTVISIDVYDWSSEVCLEEVPNVYFNTVHFEDVKEENTIIEDQLNTNPVSPEIDRLVDITMAFFNTIGLENKHWPKEAKKIIRKRGGIELLRIKDLIKIEKILGYQIIKIEKQ